MFSFLTDAVCMKSTLNSTWSSENVCQRISCSACVCMCVCVCVCVCECVCVCVYVCMCARMAKL